MAHPRGDERLTAENVQMAVRSIARLNSDGMMSIVDLSLDMKNYADCVCVGLSRCYFSRRCRRS